jgi:hypothetical protein
VEHAYRRSPDASASAVGERFVLYHRISRTAVVLNPTGSWMWSRLEMPRTADDLARDLQARYPSLSDADAARDVAAFLTELSQHKLLSVGQ